MQNEKEYWIFTFGYNQPNAGKYVKVYGSYGEARKKMMAKHGVMWAFQYSAEKWRDWVKRAEQAGMPVETELEVIK